MQNPAAVSSSGAACARSLSAIFHDRADAIELVPGDGADGEEGGDLSGFLVLVVDLPDDAEQTAIAIGNQIPARLDFPGHPFDLGGRQLESDWGRPDNGRGSG